IFSMHMVQMAFLLLLVPPLLIMGVPSWVWRKFINFPVVKPLFHFFTKPMIALILFGLVFSFYYIPLVFDVVKTSTSIHAAVNGILFISAIFCWWPVVHNLEGSYKFHGLKKMDHILGLSVLITPAYAMIIFSRRPLYPQYSDRDTWLQEMTLYIPAG